MDDWLDDQAVGSSLLTAIHTSKEGKPLTSRKEHMALSPTTPVERDRIRPKRVSSRIASRRVIRGVVLGGNALALAGVAQYLARESGRDFFDILSAFFLASLSYWIAEEALGSWIFHRLDEASIWRGFFRFLITVAIWIACDLSVNAALKAIPRG